eukprot:snap_masked-scaffold_1-processed-gene-26.27-mRNA-1 protein AED:1.00 eAED:1.00 QI:0/0/0/0/1/1/2/0/286
MEKSKKRKRSTSNKGNAISLNYYAVSHGRIPGIYFTAEHCRLQVEKFPGSRHKKFKDILQAVAVMQDAPFKIPKSSPGAISKTSDPTLSKTSDSASSQTTKKHRIASVVRKKLITSRNQSPQSSIEKNSKYLLYTNGSCMWNEMSGAQEPPSGWGYIIVDKFEHIIFQSFGKVCLAGNVSETFGAEVISNNTAEIIAIGRGLEYCLNNLILKGNKKLLVRSYSIYAICFRTLNGVKNRALILYVRGILNKVKIKVFSVSFEFVKGHSTAAFNRLADALARKGASSI